MPMLSNYLYHASAGETFDSIALQVYGNEQYSAQLLAANPEHGNTLQFEGGEALYLPIVTITTPENEFDHTPINAPWRD